MNNTRTPCPTIYPEVTTHYADGRVETKTDVPCSGFLRHCEICGHDTFCGREGRCLSSEDAAHWQQRRFDIEGAYAVIGWTRGERWNGWACPRFEKAEALTVIAETNAHSTGAITYDEATDSFICPSDYPDEQPEIWKGTVIQTPLGEKTVYAIGAWSWIWDSEELAAEGSRS